MADTHSVAYANRCNVVTTVDADAGAGDILTSVSDYTLEQSIATISGTLTASTTPAVTKVYAATVALGAGVATIDLSALTNHLNVAVDMSGLEVILVQIQATAANTTAVKMEDGAANGYPILGAASMAATIPPGASMLFYTANALGQVVDGTHEEIDFSGAGVETFSIIICCG